MASRIKYTANDETAMWRFIMRVLHEGRGMSIKGNLIWSEFSRYNTSPDCPVRSISSLNSHFRKKMLVSLSEAQIALEDIVYIHNKIPLTVFNLRTFASRCEAAGKADLIKKLKKRSYFNSDMSPDLFDTSSNTVGVSPPRHVKQSESPGSILNDSVARVIENCQIQRVREQNPDLGLKAARKEELATPLSAKSPRRSQRIAHIASTVVYEEPENLCEEANVDVPAVSTRLAKKKSILIASPIKNPIPMPTTPQTRSTTLHKRRAVPLDFSNNASVLQKERETREEPKKKHPVQLDCSVVFDSNPSINTTILVSSTIVNDENNDSRNEQRISEKSPKRRAVAVPNKDTPSDSFFDSRLLNELLDTNIEDIVYEPANEVSNISIEADQNGIEALPSSKEHLFFKCEMSEEFVSKLLEGMDAELLKYLRLELLLNNEFLQLLSISTSHEDFKQKLSSFESQFRKYTEESKYEYINLTQEDITTANFDKFSKPVNIPGTKVSWDVRIEFLNKLFSSFVNYPVAKCIKMRHRLINAEGNAAQLGTVKREYYDFFINVISQNVLDAQS